MDLGWNKEFYETKSGRCPVRDFLDELKKSDPDDFAAKALTLLTDPPLWRTMSENAVRWARSFSWDDAARRTEAMLEECVR